MKNIEDFIGVFDNYLNPDTCDKAIEMFSHMESAGLTLNRQERGYKKSEADDSFLFYCDTISMSHIGDPIYSSIKDAVWSAYREYAKAFEVALTDKTAAHHVYDFKLQKTMPGQGYHTWHYESSEKSLSNRLLAYTVYLNDIEDGGETEFLYQKRRLTPKKGRVVIWPAGFTHVHRGNPPLKEDKYIVTGWFEF